ncbi:hypothetical protein TNCV_912331 [Trichonephila clavipes]|nr:hypothetical protein TNCV_912331 [Trichonephila clavipes]
MSVVQKPLSRDYLYPSLLPQNMPARRSLAECLAQNNSSRPTCENNKGPSLFTDHTLHGQKLFSLENTATPLEPRRFTPTFHTLLPTAASYTTFSEKYYFRFQPNSMWTVDESIVTLLCIVESRRPTIEE